MPGEDEGLGADPIVDVTDKEAASPDRTKAKRDQDGAEVEAGTERRQGVADQSDASTLGVPDVERLLPLADVEALGARWESIQTGFVDEPRQSVENADRLVTEVMKVLAASFSEARADLERQWEEAGDVSTEDLRVILRRYRSFFLRLLAA